MEGKFYIMVKRKLIKVFPFVAHFAFSFFHPLSSQRKNEIRGKRPGKGIFILALKKGGWMKKKSSQSMSTQTGNENCVSIGYYNANVSAIYVYTFSLSFLFPRTFFLFILLFFLCIYFEMDFKLAIFLVRY